MHDFFKPWRRKIGVVTLVLACVFAAGLVRSHATTDRISLYPSDKTIAIVQSDLSGFLLMRAECESNFGSRLNFFESFPTNGFDKLEGLIPTDLLSNNPGFVLFVRFVVKSLPHQRSSPEFARLGD